VLLVFLLVFLLLMGVAVMAWAYVLALSSFSFLISSLMAGRLVAALSPNAFLNALMTSVASATFSMTWFVQPLGLWYFAWRAGSLLHQVLRLSKGGLLSAVVVLAVLAVRSRVVHHFEVRMTLDLSLLVGTAGINI
jgi:hypothetical protein